ncbi:ComEC/Rec2 family competence protein [Candidatus Similichlamydia laticola]|uniref:ComEC/Rec2 family competence protein n=1 Tax=Candidatus Similichlamydia laticola TaxID=2170265 RepID=UPI0015EFE878|nr:ComEC/Rec2 family competence protein [Candidatus Similichlamydia laticola]
MLPNEKILNLPNQAGPWRLSGKFYRSFLDQIRVDPKTLSLQPTEVSSLITIFFTRWAIARCLWMERVEQHLQKACPSLKISCLIETFLFGKTPQQNMKRLFAFAGLSHILVVSGLHFSCVVQSFHFFFRIIPYCPLRFLLQFLFYTLYFFLIGPRAPALRAFLSALLSSYAKIIEHPPNEFQVYGFTLTCSACLDPCSVLSLSYQFSYLAVGSLLLFRTLYRSPPSGSSKFKRVMHRLEEKGAQNLWITLVLLPLQTTFWGTFPSLAPIIGILFNDLMTWIIQLAGIGVLLSTISPLWASKLFFSFLGVVLDAAIELLWWAELNLYQIELPVLFKNNLLIFSKCCFAALLLIGDRESKRHHLLFLCKHLTQRNTQPRMPARFGK